MKYSKVRNTGIFFKTRYGKGGIPANTIVQVTRCIDYKYLCECKDNDGNTEQYNSRDELYYFINTKYSNTFIEVSRIVDDRIEGIKHLTSNVRTEIDCIYEGDFLWDVLGLTREFKGYVYKEELLSDEDIRKIIMDEIIYGIESDLQSTSCVGWDRTIGMDKNPNYHDGWYILNNGNTYTVTWCYGKIECREGIDGGWYKGIEDVGRTIFETTMDWNRYKIAKINGYIRCKLLRQWNDVIKEHPELIKVMYDNIKDWDIFKLSEEIL